LKLELQEGIAKYETLVTETEEKTALKHNSLYNEKTKLYFAEKQCPFLR